MKTPLKIITAMVFLILLGCNKDDDPKTPLPDPKPENNPPAGFGLLSPAVDASDESRSPIFTWEQATDPDGDPVTYDLFLDTAENPEIVIAENLGTTSFELIQDLEFEETYHWKVVAKDDKGMSVESMKQSFTIKKMAIKFLTQFASTKSGGDDFKTQNFTYEDSFHINLQDSIGVPWRAFLKGSSDGPVRLKLLTAKVMGSTLIYEYATTQTQKQAGVKILNSQRIHTWTLSYDTHNRIRSIVLMDNSDEARQLISIETTFSYADAIVGKPNMVMITAPDEGAIRLSLEWNRDNITEIISEIDSNDGNGFQFAGVTRLTYDNNVNPYYIITKHQFGFDDFFVTNITTGLETLWFYNCFWQSQNNIKTMEIFDSPSSNVPSYMEVFEYGYNDADYPVTATRSINSLGDMTTEDLQWSY